MRWLPTASVQLSVLGSGGGLSTTSGEDTTIIHSGHQPVRGSEVQLMLPVSGRASGTEGFHFQTVPEFAVSALLA